MVKLNKHLQTSGGRQLGWTLLATLVLVVSSLLPALQNSRALAATGCSVDYLDPHQAYVDSDAGFSFQVSNNSDTDIQWLGLSAPSTNLVLNNASSPDFTPSVSDSQVVFSQGTIAPSAQTSLYIGAHVGSYSPPTSWTVLASANADGSNPMTCGGDASLQIIDANPPVISSVAATVQGNGATISWQTDKPANSTVYYGEDESYGQQRTSGAYTTQHSFKLTNLQANTGYHYQVASTDESGNSVSSNDNTFLTAEALSTPPTTSPNAPVITSNPNAEKVPPVVSLTSQIPKVVKQAPTISGVADDNVAVAAVEYSTNGGKDWLPTEQATGLGTKHATFSFTPLLSNDGDYSVSARAVDTSGNMAFTSPFTLVIDRLPPLVGGNTVSVGPLVMQPSADSTLKTLSRVDQKITLSAVGGATSVSLDATIAGVNKVGITAYSQGFNLTRSEDTGLWSGIVSFSRPGNYTLTAHAIDGAGNTTERVIDSVYVAAPGRTLDAATHRPAKSTVTVNYLEPESHAWVVWDAAAFGQSNPQSTDKTGSFSTLLPPGTYYLSATTPGYHKFVGSIFTVKQPTPLTTQLNLQKQHGLRLGTHYLALPSFSVERTDIANTPSKLSSKSPLVGTQAPNFKLTDTNGATIQTADLLGRPTVLSFDSTWSPATAEQLPALSALQTNSDLNVVPVALQESSGRVQAYTAIADMNLRWLVDPDSALSAPYNVQSLPTHYFIDRKGVVRQVITGVLTKQQMLDILSGL